MKSITPVVERNLFQQKLRLTLRKSLLEYYGVEIPDHYDCMQYLMKLNKGTADPAIASEVITNLTYDIENSDPFSFVEIVRGFRDEFSFLSNMFPLPLEQFGHRFNSSEQLYQYLKATKISNELANEVLKQDNPKTTKKIMRGYSVDDKYKVYAMKLSLKVKFQDDDMKSMLLLTHPQMLVEYNNWGDDFWGVCKKVSGNMLKPSGKNVLGNMLMVIRLRSMENL